MHEAIGHPPVVHIRQLAFMGFSEVLKNLGTILQNLSRCKRDLAAFGPHVLILIDYPGFNLRMAAHAKSLGLKVAYYISPQVWAWKAKRAYAIKRHVDRMLCILPFEVSFYQNYGFAAQFVGHPLLDAIPPQKPLAERYLHGPIALLPGSRKQEVQRMLPLMIEVAKSRPQEQFMVAAAPGLDLQYYLNWKLPANVALWKNGAYALLSQAKAALVTSGTATLETALHHTPMAVCYKGNPLSVAIARRLIQVKYISLVNLIADRPLVRELIQSGCSPASCASELDQLMDSGYRETQLNGFKEVRQILGQGGASLRAAAAIHALASSTGGKGR
jgi:lipid-A-disaccharide synthase